jgi:allantoinase
VVLQKPRLGPPELLFMLGSGVLHLGYFLLLQRGYGGGDLSLPDHAVVLPGVVDTHVHVNEPGRTDWEGFASATAAAARGGVTTIVDMPLNSVPPTTAVEHLRAKRQAAEGKLAVDVAFWGGAVPGNVEDLPPLAEAGVVGFKCFLSPSGVEEFPPLDDVGLLTAARRIHALGSLLIVHAEDPAVLAAAPKVPGPAYADFLASRPPDSEVRAINRVIRVMRESGVRAHIVHLSSARALEAIAAAQAEGLPLTVETCPHYLSLTAESVPDAAPEFKCCPPIRDAGNREELWRGLAEGLIDSVVSDHSPTTAAEKNRGGGDLQQAWGGISGLQVGFTAVAAGALERGLGLAEVSRWMSSSTAALVGLEATKGHLGAGADADLLVYRPEGSTRVDASALAHRNPMSAFDGRTFRGAVVRTLLRGREIHPGPAEPTWGRQLR